MSRRMHAIRPLSLPDRAVSRRRSCPDESPGVAYPRGMAETSDGALHVTPRLAIPLAEVVVRVSRSGGPGGQHANTTESRVVASFDVLASATLSDAQKRRVVERLGPVVRAVAQDERSQARNRALALERLAARLADGLRVRRPRVATRPSAGSTERRLAAKRRRSAVKRGRGAAHDDEG